MILKVWQKGDKCRGYLAESAARDAAQHGFIDLTNGDLSAVEEQYRDEAGQLFSEWKAVQGKTEVALVETYTADFMEDIRTTGSIEAAKKLGHSLYDTSLYVAKNGKIAAKHMFQNSDEGLAAVDWLRKNKWEMVGKYIIETDTGMAPDVMDESRLGHEYTDAHYAIFTADAETLLAQLRMRRLT
jgi:hypothetical protein